MAAIVTTSGAPGIDLPITGIAHSPDDTSDHLIKMVGGAPLVVKAGRRHAKGSAWYWRRRVQAAESVMRFGLNAHITVQEYIAEAKGCDIRCLVVGNEGWLTAIERCAKAGDFQLTSSWRGGPASRRSRPERDIAIRRTDAGAGCGGVSIFYAPRASAGDE